MSQERWRYCVPDVTAVCAGTAMTAAAAPLNLEANASTLRRQGSARADTSHTGAGAASSPRRLRSASYGAAVTFGRGGWCSPAPATAPPEPLHPAHPPTPEAKEPHRQDPGTQGTHPSCPASPCSTSLPVTQGRSLTATHLIINGRSATTRSAAPPPPLRPRSPPPPPPCHHSIVPPGGPSPLLLLPERVQHEVLSWCSAAPDACALLRTCRDLYALRSDPSALALLLVRHPWPSTTAAYAALDACAPRQRPDGPASGAAAAAGAAAALCAAICCLLAAGLECGGLFTSPTPLMQALLQRGAAEGDETMLAQLLAAPKPPDADADDGAALACAITHLQLGSATVLLERHNADPGAGAGRLFALAAEHPDRLPFLACLLRRSLSAAGPLTPAAGYFRGAARAAELDNAPAARLLLPLLDAATTNLNLLGLASRNGASGVLTLLVGVPEASAANLSTGLCLACAKGHVACVSLLLEQGADVHVGDGQLLLWAVHSNMVFPGDVPEHREGRVALVAVLLRHGAVVTPVVAAAARAAGHEEVVALLLAAA